MPFITPTAYFPPANWFAVAARSGTWQLEAHENYQRKGWRNRALIAGPNGLLRLSLPLEKGKNQQMPIREVKLVQEYDWQREHEASIRTAYGRSPFYEYYAEGIFSIIREEQSNLFKLNKALISRIIDLLNLPIELRETDDFLGPATSKSMPELAPYQQVFTDRFGFQGGLSVLDALFCLGPSFVNQPLAVGAAAGAKTGIKKP